MKQFPDSAHAAIWAGLCPGNNESAGKRQSGRTRKGNCYLRRTLIHNAWAVAHMKKCYLAPVFYCIARRRGLKKAAMAIAHKILVIAFHVIRAGGVYHEIGVNSQDQLHADRTVHRLTRRIEDLGFTVTLTRALEATAHSAEDTSAIKKKKGRPCLCEKRGISVYSWEFRLKGFRRNVPWPAPQQRMEPGEIYQAPSPFAELSEHTRSSGGSGVAIAPTASLGCRAPRNNIRSTKVLFLFSLPS